MAQYQQKVKALAQSFQNFQLVQINRSLNSHTDALSKLASAKETLERTILVEVLHKANVEEDEVVCIDLTNDWRTPISNYLVKGELSSDLVEARKMKTQGARFTIIDGMLYKRAFTMLLLKCLGPQDTKFTLLEVCCGACGEYLGARALATKVI